MTMDDEPIVLHWWQLPDNAPHGVVRQVAQRNALVAVAARAQGNRIEVAAIALMGAFLAVTRDASAIEIPMGQLARQNLLESAMLNASQPVAEAVVRLWQEVMAASRAEWEAETAVIMAKWGAPVAAQPRPGRKRRIPAAGPPRGTA